MHYTYLSLKLSILLHKQCPQDSRFHPSHWLSSAPIAYYPHYRSIHLLLAAILLPLSNSLASLKFKVWDTCIFLVVPDETIVYFLKPLQYVSFQPFTNSHMKTLVYFLNSFCLFLIISCCPRYNSLLSLNFLSLF